MPTMVSTDRAGQSARIAGPRRVRAGVRMLVVGLALALACPGCGVLGRAGDALMGGPRTVSVDAEYRGLEGQTVAVLVAADDYMLYRHPDAPRLVATAVSGQIAAAVPTATLTDPRQVLAFQDQDPYWNTRSYADLLGQVAVQRLVLVDLVQYTTHDPEARHAWRGVLSATVSVVEAQPEPVETIAYRQTVAAAYPDRSVTLLNSDEPTIELGMLKAFAARVAGLFHDHREIRR